MSDEAADASEVVTIAGVEVVTIPLAHYADLLACQRREAAGQEITPPPAAVRRVSVDTRSRLFDDPEVTGFLVDIMGTMRLADAHNACADRFGEARAPSRATIGRFWQRRRGTR